MGAQLHSDNADIFFCRQCRIQGMLIRRGVLEVAQFAFEDPPTVVVKLTALPPSSENEPFTDSIECLSWLKCDPPRKVRELLAEVESGKLPTKSEERGVTFNVDPTGLKAKTLSFGSGMPQHFDAFVEGVSAKLADYTDRTIRVLRWRLNAHGDHRAVHAALNFVWSRDGTKWMEVPAKLSADLEIKRDIRLDQQLAAEVQQLVSSNGDEPIAHTLLREAWSQRAITPRSALVTGIAALEVGVKHFITDLLPASRWMVDNLPSPPVLKMLEEYVPTLPARLTLAGKVIPPPKSTLEELKKGIRLRNLLAHTGAHNASNYSIRDILTAVHDTLRLLDFYRGYGWALALSSPDFIDQIRKIDETAIRKDPCYG